MPQYDDYHAQSDCAYYDCSTSDVFLPEVHVEVAFGDVRRVAEVTLVFVAGVQAQVHGQVGPA